MGHDDQPSEDRQVLRRGVVAGAFAGAGAVMALMPFFFPLGRIVDPTIGGDDPHSDTGLAAELALGAIAGVVLSPLGALIGAVLGRLLDRRRITVAVVALVTAASTAVAVGLFLTLNGGLVDERGTYDSLRFVLLLGVLAGVLGVALFGVARRSLPGQFVRRRPSAA